MTGRFAQIEGQNTLPCDVDYGLVEDNARVALWHRAAVFAIVGYQVDRPDQIIDDAADETMKLALAWCTEQFGGPVGAVKKDHRWDYHFGLCRVFVFKPDDAFEFKLRWC